MQYVEKRETSKDYWWKEVSQMCLQVKQRQIAESYEYSAEDLWANPESWVLFLSEAQLLEC